MPQSLSMLQKTYLEKVLAQAENQQNPLFTRFLSVFGGSVPPEDLQQLEEKAFFDLTQDFWEFIKTRPENAPKIRVIPSQNHTFVEIVNDDMPFLVSSAVAEINRLGYAVSLIIHPVVKIQRDAAGALQDIEAGHAESLMHIQLPALNFANDAQKIEQGLHKVFADVRLAVNDWQAMRTAVQTTITTLNTQKAAIEPAEVQETIAFLEWLSKDHFTFLGYREIEHKGQGDAHEINVKAGAGLGILRDDEKMLFDGVRKVALLPQDIQSFLDQPRLIHFTKTNLISPVHRPVPLDVISIKTFNAQGELTGENRFVGLFTSEAYNSSPRHIPFLRRKVASVLAEAGFDPKSHDGKSLTHIIETFPRDDLYQISVPELLQISLGILHLQERQRVALFIRQDTFERYVACFVYVPRDRYSIELRQKIQDILELSFNGKAKTIHGTVEDAALARLYFVIETNPKDIPAFDLKAIEEALVAASWSWQEKLKNAMRQQDKSPTAARLFVQFGAGFPVSYQENFAFPNVIADIKVLDELYSDERLRVLFYQQTDTTTFHLKLFALDNPLPLSDVLPMLENMGLRVISETPYKIKPSHHATGAWIHDLEVYTKNRAPLDIAKAQPLFADLFSAVWLKKADDDTFNTLVLTASVTWRQVIILRSYAKYLKQISFGYSEQAIAEALINNPAIAIALIDLFSARFSIAENNAEQAEQLINNIKEMLQEVTSLAEDKIINTLLHLMQNTLRTNYFQPDENGQDKDYVSYKLNSKNVEGLPLPKPNTEIFVYSTQMESIHLRGSKVARGGIRWSDRKEDYRSEVLGLMKAQMVKNAVIVPSGSKGGFIVKRPPLNNSREALQQEVIACYRTMMHGMLDMADTIRGGVIIPPSNVICHDETDPYLVVAADKGTATFSDIANEISLQYGFWLGDAFASGGSAGYDHKKMGITAKGGWEAVKRHFREMGVNIQEQDFTVVGVGDMAGDVFGNGMLLSKHIRLIAAFNHKHIFIDPNPDSASSFMERERLFNLAGSQWTDYDVAKLSKGGKIFDRAAKSLEITPEIRSLFGLQQNTITPNDLIKVILKSQADLLWLGGIGTYIRSSIETDADATDKANDALRITAKELRVKVIGEGANLGMTQRARVEFALNGGRVNTDAIDNSAGVDCSDHEVNIKILLQQVMDSGAMDIPKRNVLLEQMTDEVAQLVLKNNYLQTQALSLAQHRSNQILHQQASLIRYLEKKGSLNRALEFLPDDEEIQRRFALGLGLTRPESAILLAYSKIDLVNQLIDTNLPDEVRMLSDLKRYFPIVLQEKFSSFIENHPLKRDIIVTHAANSMVNRVGSHFVNEVQQATGMSICDIARAYAITRDSFDLRRLWQSIGALDNRVPASLQMYLLLQINQLVEYCTYWFLQQEQHPLKVTELVDIYLPKLQELRKVLPNALTDAQKATLEASVAALAQDGVPQELAVEVAAMNVLAVGCDIVKVAMTANTSVEEAARLYFAIGSHCDLEWLRAQTKSLKITSSWAQKASDALLSDLHTVQRALTLKILQANSGSLNAWAERNANPLASYKALLQELHGYPELDVAMLLVASRLLKGLVG